ncbi:MAG: ATP-binding protein [Euryarchaeota archaeon]
MIIAVASGKGGTGKTTVAVNLALALQREYNVKFFDCDVEAPNAYLFLKPEITHSEPVMIGCPTVNGALCTFCGKCAEVCAFNALVVLKERVLLYPELCHDCGGCELFCLQNAIGRTEHKIGTLESGFAGNIAFFHGRLTPGEPFSPPVIRALKRKLSDNSDNSVVILDAPPGTSCPVVTAIEGSDFCLLVTEPTPFGLNDLALAVELVQKLEIRAGVVVNRADIGDNKVDAYCAKKGLPVLMRLPYDQELSIRYAQGIPAVGVLSGYQKRFSQLCQDINKLAR